MVLHRYSTAAAAQFWLLQSLQRCKMFIKWNEYGICCTTSSKPWSSLWRLVLCSKQTRMLLCQSLFTVVLLLLHLSCCSGSCRIFCDIVGCDPIVQLHYTVLWTLPRAPLSLRIHCTTLYVSNGVLVFMRRSSQGFRARLVAQASHDHGCACSVLASGAGEFEWLGGITERGKCTRM